MFQENNNFLNDLKKGQIYELKATEYFDYEKVFFPKGHFSDYDFILDDNIKVEVKSDRKASRSGFLSIEYQNNKCPSGIYATQADFYMYFINYEKHDEVFKIPTNELIKLCKTKGRKISGGDGNRARFYLINKLEVEKYKIEEKKHQPLKMEFERVYTIPFGKFKGQIVDELFQTKAGRNYLNWLCCQQWFDRFQDIKNRIKYLNEK